MSTDQDAALLTFALPDRKTKIQTMAARLGAYWVIRGHSHKGVFTTDSRGSQYLIVDNAAEMNVVGKKDSALLTLRPVPLAPTILLGVGESRLVPLSAGALDIVFVATLERPGRLPKTVVQIIRSHHAWRVAMVMRGSLNARCPALPAEPTGTARDDRGQPRPRFGPPVPTHGADDSAVHGRTAPAFYGSYPDAFRLGAPLQHRVGSVPSVLD
jgi:hypothetical protein